MKEAAEMQKEWKAKLKHDAAQKSKRDKKIQDQSEAGAGESKTRQVKMTIHLYNLLYFYAYCVF